MILRGSVASGTLYILRYEASTKSMVVMIEIKVYIREDVVNGCGELI